MYSILPYQIAYGPISTLIILYILELHGTVIDASYAITLGYAVSIPASILWGYAIDTYNKRRSLILISFCGLLLSLVMLFLFRSVLDAILIYGFMSFAIAANATPINLLVMDNNPEKLWEKGFSKLQMLSSLGMTIGLLFAFFVTGFFPITELILFLVPFCIAAIVLTVFINEERAEKVRRSLISYPIAFASRLISKPLFFLRLPPINMIKNFANSLKFNSMKRNYLNTLYLGILIFYVGGSIFNTAYPAGLKEAGLTTYSIFGIIFAGVAMQVIFFQIFPLVAHNRNRKEVAAGSLVVRSVAYFMISMIFVFFGQDIGVIGNIILYSIGSGVAYSIFYTVLNVLLFEAIGKDKRGRKLGLYSGLVGVGSISGSLLAGYLSFYVSYWFAFLVAGFLTLYAAHIMMSLKEFEIPKKEAMSIGKT
jgi:MFS family permease